MTATLTYQPADPATTTAVAARAVHATKRYGKGDTTVTALDDVTVDFRAHEFTAIMGPSGSGKSTLMHNVAGLDTLTSGNVYIGDVDVSSLNDRKLTKLRRDKIGFIFQAFNLIPTLTALENITLPSSLAGRKVEKAWGDVPLDSATRPGTSWERHHCEILQTVADGDVVRGAMLLREHLAEVGCDPVALRIVRDRAPADVLDEVPSCAGCGAFSTPSLPPPPPSRPPVGQVGIRQLFRRF